MAVLLRASSELDIVGDLTAVVDSQGELVAWAGLLPTAALVLWRAEETGRRHICLTAAHRAAPIRGQVTVTLDGDKHRDLWGRLSGDVLQPGTERVLTTADLFRAWNEAGS